MSADDRAVDDEVFHVRIVSKVLQHRFPDAGITPASEAFVDAVPLAVLLRQHTPLRATAVQPENGLDKKAAFGFMTDIDIRMRSKECDYL